MEVEERHIPYEELETFDEMGSCGTAAVISPIAEIHDLDNGKKFVFSTNNEAGPKSTILFNALRAIQLVCEAASVSQESKLHLPVAGR